MSIKGFFTVAIASTALLTGLSSYSTALFSTKIEQQISLQNSVDGIEVSIIDRNNGFFARKQTYKIVLSAEYLQQVSNIPEIEQDIELYVPHHFVAYPLYIASELNVDFSRGSLPQLLKNIGLTDIAHQVNINSNILLQSSQLALNIAPLIHSKGDISYSHDEVKITADTDIDFKQGNLLANFTGVNLDIGERGKFSLSGLTSDSTFNTIDDIMIFTAMSGSLNKVSFTDNVKNIVFSGEDINSTSHYSSLANDHVSLVADMNIANMVFKDSTVDYLVTNTELAFSIDDIDKSGYLELEKISHQAQPAPEVMKSALMKLVETGGKGNISKLNFNINNVQFTSSANFALPAYQGMLAHNELNQHVTDKFVMNADFSLSNNYAEKFSQLGMIVEHFIQRGFAVKDNTGNISSKITFSKGQLTANDNAVQM